MRKYGKLEEYKASIFHAVMPFDLSFSGTQALLRFNPDPEDLENIDEDIYGYDGVSSILCREAGWYDMRYSINYEQSSGGDRDTVYAWMSRSQGFTGPFEVLFQTLGLGYIRNNSARNGTISITQLVKIEVPNSILTITITNLENNASLFVPAGAGSVFLQKLRPLRPGE